MVNRTNSTGSEPTLVDGAAQTAEQGIIGGGQNEGSQTNNLTVTKHACNGSVLSAGITAKNIGAGGTTPIYLMGVYISAALIGTLTISTF